MAGRGGGGGRKGGGGKKTGRSQGYNALRQFGYPSPRELRMEAQGLASAAVPTVGQVSRPYQAQIRSSRDYLSAVQSALADTMAGVNTGYDQAVSQTQGVDQAAQARLAGLGLGADAGGSQAATGALGDSQTAHLIANAATAKAAAAQNPAIAAGQASQFAQVTGNKLLDALANRRDSLSQAFFQAMQQVQAQGLAKAQFNQGQYQFQQNMALQQQQMAQQQAEADRSYALQVQAQKDNEKQFRENFKAQYGYDPGSGGPKGKNAGLLGGNPSKIAKALGMSVPEVLDIEGQVVTGLSGSKGKHDVPVYQYKGKDGRTYKSNVKPNAGDYEPNTLKIVQYQNFGGSSGAMAQDVPFTTAVQTARAQLPNVPFALILQTVRAFYSANADPVQTPVAYRSYQNYLRALQGLHPIGPHDGGIG